MVEGFERKFSKSYGNYKKKDNKNNNKSLDIVSYSETRCSFERVWSFSYEYLGVKLTDNEGKKIQTLEIIIKGQKMLRAQNAIMKFKNISSKAKERIFATEIRPTVIYVKREKLNEKETLEVSKRKVLSKIYGGKRER